VMKNLEHLADRLPHHFIIISPVLFHSRPLYFSNSLLRNCLPRIFDCILLRLRK
jgi:hypothetical protein